MLANDLRESTKIANKNFEESSYNKTIRIMETLHNKELADREESII